MFYCKQPFTRAEIDKFGDVYNCCRFHLPIKLGNIYENTFEEIWNSKNAIKIREHILRGDYSLCNQDACSHLLNKNNNQDIHTENLKPLMEKGPKHVSFCHDKECNIACIICRDEIWRNTDTELQNLNDRIETMFLPMLKDTEIVTISAHGDPFGSRHSRLLIKKIRENYPDIKFEIFTNGTLFTPENIKDLGIENNFYNIQISIHSASKETYSKMVRNGELYFDKLMTNLDYASELSQKYHFDFYLYFVVTSLNYKDIPAFIELGTKLKAKPTMWEYRDEQLQSENKHPEYVITNKNHPEYKNLIDVLNNPILYSAPWVGLSPILKQIQSEKTN